MKPHKQQKTFSKFVVIDVRDFDLSWPSVLILLFWNFRGISHMAGEFACFTLLLLRRPVSGQSRYVIKWTCLLTYFEKWHSHSIPSRTFRFQKSFVCFKTAFHALYRVIQKDGLTSLVFKARTVNSASTHARQSLAVFQVLCSLYRLTSVGYAQNSL